MIISLLRKHANINIGIGTAPRGATKGLLTEISIGGGVRFATLLPHCFYSLQILFVNFATMLLHYFYSLHILFVNFDFYLSSYLYIVMLYVLFMSLCVSLWF